MKKGFFTLILCSFFISGSSIFGYIPKPNPQEQENFELLFIQSAEEVTLKQNPRNPERWTITLKNIDPDIAYFSEKPRKMAGKVTIQDFIEEWNLNNKNSPSGSLVTKFSHADAQGTDSDRKVILSNPRYNAKRMTLTYDARNAYGTDNLQNGSHKDPVLFIEKY